MQNVWLLYEAHPGPVDKSGVQEFRVVLARNGSCPLRKMTITFRAKSFASALKKVLGGRPQNDPKRYDGKLV